MRTDPQELKANANYLLQQLQSMTPEDVGIFIMCFHKGEGAAVGAANVSSGQVKQVMRAFIKKNSASDLIHIPESFWDV